MRKGGFDVRYKNGRNGGYAVYIREGDELPKETAGGVEYVVKAVIVLNRKAIKDENRVRRGSRRYREGRVRYHAGYRELEWRRIRLKGKKVLIQRMGGTVTLHDELPRLGINYAWSPTNRRTGPALATFPRAEVVGLAELPATTIRPASPVGKE